MSGTELDDLAALSYPIGLSCQHPGRGQQIPAREHFTLHDSRAMQSLSLPLAVPNGRAGIDPLTASQDPRTFFVYITPHSLYGTRFFPSHCFTPCEAWQASFVLGCKSF